MAPYDRPQHMTKRRAHAYYAGSVQGVGFRYTAESVAVSLGLTGWVKNLDDGRVELVCEGPEPAITALLTKINDVFGGYIRDQDVEWLAATGEFDAFDVRF